MESLLSPPIFPNDKSRVPAKLLVPDPSGRHPTLVPHDADYVAGFMFSSNLDHVVLIKKNRPTWQSGRFNAVGGRVEDGEIPVKAMVREFKEETSVETDYMKWTNFADLVLPSGEKIAFFAIVSYNVFKTKTVTDEEVFHIFVPALIEGKDCHHLAYEGAGLASTYTKPLYNIPWLVRMAIESLRTGSCYDIVEKVGASDRHPEAKSIP